MHPTEIKIVKRSKGNPFLFVNQYQFYYSNSDKNKTKYYWKCMNYNKCKCKGTAITNSIQPAKLIGGNSNHTCIPNLQSTIPMPSSATSMPYYSDSTAPAAYGPPLTASVSTAATPSVSSNTNSEDPSMIKARAFVGNLNEVCVSREMLCNENSPILCDSTDAHEMSKDYCIGEIVDEEKQTYTCDKKPIAPTTTTSATSGGFNGLNKNIAKNRLTGTSLKAGKNVNVKNSLNQTNFNQHTTNFIVFFSEPLKPVDV